MSEEEEIERIKRGIYNFDYISDIGYNDFLLICNIHENFESILEDMLNFNPKLINYISKVNQDNILLAALRYSNFKLAEYLILKTNINLDYIGKNFLSAFSWALHRNNEKICNLILEKNPSIFDIDDFELSENEEIKIKIIKKIINIKQKPYKKKFRMYLEEDFEIIRTLGSGTYGEVFLAKFIQNDKKVSIKKFKFCKDEDAIKEIYFLKFLNGKNISLDLYGIYFKDECIYLVSELLKITLHDYFTLLNYFNDEEKDNLIKTTFKKLLKCIDKMHNNGIIHNDLKGQNIMISYNNKVKIIDFGISDFLGVKPSRKNIIEYYAPEYFKAPDSYDIEIGIFILNERQMNFETNRKSYASDIFSLGRIFCHYYFNDDLKKKKYVINDEIYENEKYTNKLIEYKVNFDGWIKLLLKNMLRINSLDRLTAKELIKLLNDPQEKNTFNEMNFFNQIIQKKISYRDNSLLETKYLDDIILNYKDFTFLEQKNSSKLNYKKIISFECDLDSLISSIIFFSNDDTYELNEYLDIFNIISNNSSKKIKSLDIMKKELVLYPITTYIEYILFNLKKEIVEENEILEIELFLTENIIKYCFFRNLNIDCKIFEIIQLIYLTKYLEFDFITVNKNHENYKDIKKIIKENSFD
uniref:Protein kinase domain-containing protein n=1 Tax=viral metagenome TaxID=1070528 RepID=A0A6C0AFN7_9ZZZZ